MTLSWLQKIILQPPVVILRSRQPQQRHYQLLNRCVVWNEDNNKFPIRSLAHIHNNTNHRHHRYRILSFKQIKNPVTSFLLPSQQQSWLWISSFSTTAATVTTTLQQSPQKHQQQRSFFSTTTTILSSLTNNNNHTITLSSPHFLHFHKQQHQPHQSPHALQRTQHHQQIRTFANHRHQRIMKYTKGYRGRSKNCFSIAIRRLQKAWQYAYRDRKTKKRIYRTLWIQRIQAGVRQYNIQYSRFIRSLVYSNIQLNRKVLSDIAATEPFTFKAILDVTKYQQREYDNELLMKKENNVVIKEDSSSEELVLGMTEKAA